MKVSLDIHMAQGLLQVGARIAHTCQALLDLGHIGLPKEITVKFDRLDDAALHVDSGVDFSHREALNLLDVEIRRPAIVPIPAAVAFVCQGVDGLPILPGQAVLERALGQSFDTQRRCPPEGGGETAPG